MDRKLVLLFCLIFFACLLKTMTFPSPKFCELWGRMHPQSASKVGLLQDCKYMLQVYVPLKLGCSNLRLNLLKRNCCRERKWCEIETKFKMCSGLHLAVKNVIRSSSDPSRTTSHRPQKITINGRSHLHFYRRSILFGAVKDRVKDRILEIIL